MTRYINNELDDQAHGVIRPNHAQVQEAVMKKRGWYLYHENSLSSKSSANLGRSRTLTCSADSGKLKGLIDFIKKS